MSKVRGFWHRRERWRLVTRLMARDGTNCTICGEMLDRAVLDPDHDRYITFDHIVSRSVGGNDAVSNKRLAHRACNMRRGNDPLIPEEAAQRPSAASAARFLALRAASQPVPKAPPEPAQPDPLDFLIACVKAIRPPDVMGSEPMRRVVEESRLCPGCGKPLPAHCKRACSARCASRLGGRAGGYFPVRLRRRLSRPPR